MKRILSNLLVAALVVLMLAGSLGRTDRNRQHRSLRHRPAAEPDLLPVGENETDRRPDQVVLQRDRPGP